MRIGMQVWGSHGDIRPLWALAEGLQRDGHEVTLVVSCVHGGTYDSSMSRTGVRIEEVASPVIADAAAYAKVERLILEEADPLKQVQVILDRLFVPVEARMYAAAERLCATNDLVIGHFFHYPLRTAAERVGRPYVSVVLVPSAIPSRFNPPAGFPTLGALGNRLAWWVVRTLLNKRLKRYPDSLRMAHGLPPAADMATGVWASKRLTLVAASAVLCAPQPDWPDNYRVCGFFDMPHISQEGTLSDEFAAFLAKGEPPLYMTFGSVMPSDLEKQRETIELLRSAAALAGCRAVIQAPSWQSCGFEATDEVFYVVSAPYQEVFPRCSAIVHHGGAGTAQAALSAGRPSVIVAHIAEQEFWGRQLQRLGVAPAPLRARRLTAARLATAITNAVGSSAMTEAAVRAGAGMRAEDGVRTAVETIERMFEE